MFSTQRAPSEIDLAPGRLNGAGSGSDQPLLRELDALRRSDAVLRDFIETSTISLHWVGADGTILWANQAELDLLGYTGDEYIGRNIAQFHADEAVINDILARLSRGEILRDYPARLRHRDGSIRHVLINSSVLFEDGKFIHTRCFTRDVTALKQEQEIREEQQRLDALVAQIGTYLVGSGTLDDMLRNCAHAITEVRGVALVRIWIHDADENVLHLQASAGLSAEAQGAAAPISMGTRANSKIAPQGQPYVTHEIVSDTHIQEHRWAREQGIAAVASYRLVVEGRRVGVLEVFSRLTFSDVALTMMARAADQIAAGIARKRIEAALRASESRLAAEYTTVAGY